MSCSSNDDNDVESIVCNLEGDLNVTSESCDEGSQNTPQQNREKEPEPGVFNFSDKLDLAPEVDNATEAPEVDNATEAPEVDNATDRLDKLEEEKEEPISPRKTRSKDSNKEMQAQDILASLPYVERLRGVPGSTLSGGKSDFGENISDRESVASGAITRNLRNKDKKSVKVSKSGTKKAGRFNTRSSKGKGRRSVAKKKPLKGITSTPTPVISNKIYYKGEYYVVGDIVSVTDVSGDIYYAQLRGFLTDQFGDKSGAISWLLPTTGSPPPNEGFHPATYIIGPEEDIPRSMEVFTFVMHAPSDYFYDSKSPYRTSCPPAVLGKEGFRAVRLGPRIIRTVDNKTVYVGIYS